MASAAELQILITGDSRSAQKAMADLSKGGDKLKDVLGGVTKVAGGFLAANVISGAGSKLMGLFNDSTKAASDLGESINAINVVFGEGAKQILDWGKTASTQVGLSQRAFNELATPLGAMLQNMGIKDFTGQTIELTKRAADMASVFNTDVTEALGAITAAMRGETDPIERFGVTVNAAKVELEAMAMTGKTTAASLTDQEKAAARLSLIYQQTQKVAGDFTNTSDSLANKTRIQQARMEELQATIGTKLIPVQLMLTEAKMKFIDFMVAKGIPTLEALYAKHWPAISKALQDAGAFIEKHRNTWEAVLTFIYEHSVTKIQGTIQLISGIAETWSRVVSGVKALVDGDWRTAWDEFSGIPAAMWDIAEGTFKSTWGKLPDLMLSVGKDAIQGLWNGMKEKWEEVKGWLGNAVSDIPGQAKKLLGIGSPSKVFHEIGEDTMEGFINGLQAKWGSVDSFMAQVNSLVTSATPAMHAKWGGFFGNGNAVQMLTGLAEDEAGRLLEALGVETDKATKVQRRYSSTVESAITPAQQFSTAIASAVPVLQKLPEILSNGMKLVETPTGRFWENTNAPSGGFVTGGRTIGGLTQNIMSSAGGHGNLGPLTTPGRAGGGNIINVNFYNAGSVVTDRELMGLLRDQMGGGALRGVI